MSANPKPKQANLLAQLLNDREATIGIIGLGYVGLPLANAAVSAGYKVLGFDVDPAKIEKLNSGESYLKHLDNSWLPDAVERETFSATDAMSRLIEPDVLVVCVPTPITESRAPDLSYVIDTTKQIAKTLRPGQLISLESTTYPGTTRQELLPLLEATGIDCGEGFFLAYSPEREDPGNKNFAAKNIPKLVGGIDERSRKLAVQFYDSVVAATVDVSSCEVAEAAKILENTYRAVNIALVNELKVLFSKIDIDIWEVVEAAATKPFGFQAFYPGPGLGGHCIPIDPFYLSWLARRHNSNTRFIELAGEINSAMPEYVIERLVLALNDREKSLKGSSVLVLGVAYKKDVDDVRESPAFRLIELLSGRGAKVDYSDPHVPQLKRMRKYDFSGRSSVEITPESLSNYDAVLIATDHSEFDWSLICKHSSLVVDTRNATKDVSENRENIVKA